MSDPLKHVEPAISSRIPVEFVAELRDKMLNRYDVVALDTALADYDLEIRPRAEP